MLDADPDDVWAFFLFRKKFLLILTVRYLFLGWSKDRNATSTSYSAGGSYTDNADVTLYAVWRYDPETYSIRYNANGGTGAPASQTKTNGIPLTLSAVKPTRAGYEFLGWSTDPTTMLTNYAPGERYTDEASVTLYAVWRYIPKTYEVKYDANGGGNTPASQTKTEDVTLILTSTIPARYLWIIRNWFVVDVWFQTRFDTLPQEP